MTPSLDPEMSDRFHSEGACYEIEKVNQDFLQAILDFAK